MSRREGYRGTPVTVSWQRRMNEPLGGLQGNTCYRKLATTTSAGPWGTGTGGHGKSGAYTPATHYRSFQLLFNWPRPAKPKPKCSGGRLPPSPAQRTFDQPEEGTQQVPMRTSARPRRVTSACASSSLADRRSPLMPLRRAKLQWQ